MRVIAKAVRQTDARTSQAFAGIFAGMTKPSRPPEGEALDKARTRAGLSAREAADRAGMSEARWRQIVNGYQPAGRGQTITVHAPDATLARMAAAVNLPAQALRTAGRDRAADTLEDLLQPITPAEAASASESAARLLDADMAHFTDAQLLREIEARMAMMAATLQASGHGEWLGWALGPEGELGAVSRPATLREPPPNSPTAVKDPPEESN